MRVLGYTRSRPAVSGLRACQQAHVDGRGFANHPTDGPAASFRLAVEPTNRYLNLAAPGRTVSIPSGGGETLMELLHRRRPLGLRGILRVGQDATRQLAAILHP